MARQYGAESEQVVAIREQIAKENRQKANTRKLIEGIASVVLVGAGVINIVAGIMTTASVQDELGGLQKQIEAQSIVRDEKKAAAEVNKNTIVEVDEVVNSAADEGLRVCELQNALNKSTIERLLSGNTKLSVEHQKMLQELATYFPKGSNSNRSIRTSWFLYGTWHFDSTYDYSGENKVFLWTCYEDDDVNRDRLLGYVAANYDPVTKTFKNAAFCKTKHWITVYNENVDKYGFVDEELDVEDFDENVVPDVTVPDVTVPYEPDDVVIPDIEIEDTTPAVTTTVTTTTVTTTTATEPEVIEPEVIEPEDEYFYGWSTAHGCWGYFRSDGTFLTIEQYEREVW
ncbi:hypothetical protein J6A31_07460 [bacterium]|nr:hypothetical protein [bacterium]